METELLRFELAESQPTGKAQRLGTLSAAATNDEGGRSPGGLERTHWGEGVKQAQTTVGKAGWLWHYVRTLAFHHSRHG
jgi:hypothetical protein